MEVDYILLARLQFGITASIHIIFPSLIIGLVIYLSVLEILWLKTKREIYLIQYQFWLKPFAILFVVGLITGVVLSYQLDAIFSDFYHKTINILIPIRKLEFANAMLLEAGCFGIMIWGWQRVGNRLHLLATLMVTLGVLVSVNCILARNSWMQTPSGFSLIDGQLLLKDQLAAILNPSFPYRLLHMIGAALLSTAFFVMGISAWFLLKRHHQEFARFNLAIALPLIEILVLLQLISGDLHGLNTRDHQPIKLAAIEGLWDTTEGAPMVVFGIPDQALERNHYAVEIPKLASLIITHQVNGRITGLKEVPKEERPYVPVVFFSFRIMVAMGLLMLVVGTTGVVLQLKNRLYDCRWFLLIACGMLPSGLIATIAGWWVTEAGRQPWVVYGLIKTAEVVNPLSASHIIKSLCFIGIVYGILVSLAIYYLWRVVKGGPQKNEWLMGKEVLT
jgi:cytochrome d ubiquinol oxidase subunit I